MLSLTKMQRQINANLLIILTDASLGPQFSITLPDFFDEFLKEFS